MSQSSLESTELPALKPRTHCVLVARDPNFIYAYWDYTQQDVDRARNQLKFKGGDSQLILRVYDITRIRFNGSNANHTWDLDVGFSTKNWYIHVWQDNADYCAELGFRWGDDRFIPLTRSNIARTPPSTASSRNDLIWQDIKAHKESQPYIKEDIQGHYQGVMRQQSKGKSAQVKQPKSTRIYHLTTQDIRAYYMKLFAGVSKKKRGKVPSLEDILKRKLKLVSWQKARPLMIKSESKGASEILSGLQAGASEGRLNKGKFFLEIWTELVVHGRTEPDAALWLNQKGIKLNPDGTFSLRYALPDGEIPLKFMAQSSGGDRQRHISTRVEREKTTYE